MCSGLVMDGARGSDVLRPVRPEGGGDAGPGSPPAPGPWPPVQPARSLLSTLEGTVTHCQGPSGSLAWGPRPPPPPSISLITPRERSAPLLPPALDPGQTVPLMATQTCPPEAVLVSRVQTTGLWPPVLRTGPSGECLPQFHRPSLSWRVS